MLFEEILQVEFLREDKTNIYCHKIKRISYYIQPPLFGGKTDLLPRSEPWAHE